MDPFGHGLMMPYLMTLVGINQIVIGRINSNIKNVLKQHHQLHFRWAQTWDPVKTTAYFCNPRKSVRANVVMWKGEV